MKSQTFKNEDKISIAYYNENGDFLSIEEKTFNSLQEANNFLGIMEDTALGDVIQIIEPLDIDDMPKSKGKAKGKGKKEETEDEDTKIPQDNEQNIN